jgi:hypothetical protein
MPKKWGPRKSPGGQPASGKSTSKGWSKEKFLAVLGKAHQAEGKWVDQMRTTHGRAVANGVKLVLPDHNPRADFCPTPDAVAAVAIEIKLRNLEFTGPEDFPYDTVFVDDVTGLRRGEQPFAWVYISQVTGHWVWLCAIDRDGSWQERVVFDSMRGFAMPTLVAPSKFLRPASQLCELLFSASGLQWVDGASGAFGEAGSGDDKCDPSPRGRGRKAPKEPG